MRNGSRIIFLTLVIGGFLIFGRGAAAATTPAYQGEKVSQNYNTVIGLTYGNAITFEVKYKNTGTATWENGGANLVALNLSGPYGRKSSFQHKWWRARYAPCKLLEKSVAPGEVGTFRFALQAPERPGMYVENYQLAVKGIDYMPETNLQVFFEISNPKYKGAAATINVPLPVVTTPISTVTSTGAINVSSSSSTTGIVATSTTEELLFNPTRYTLKPLNEYPAITLPLNLTSTPVGVGAALSKGPDIRIGLYSTEEVITIKANGPYEIRDENDVMVGNNFEGSLVTIKFDFKKKLYELLEDGKRILLSNTPLRFAPKNENVIMEIPSNINTNTWKTYMRFRGILEVAYTDDDTLWIINELPFEDYLKGSGECGNNNPAGYLGAMAIAERTYAMTNWLSPTKHAKRGFVLVAHSGDQVYRGYDRERIQPNVVAAVNATNGLLVTYGGQVAITPYFARSNGTTKKWTAVWGGTDKAWLQPKYVPYDQGKTMFGHGVGMSAWGAWDMAENRGMNWEEIIRYFYTGVELQKAY